MKKRTTKVKRLGKPIVTIWTNGVMEFHETPVSLPIETSSKFVDAAIAVIADYKGPGSETPAILHQRTPPRQDPLVRLSVLFKKKRDKVSQSEKMPLNPKP